MRRQVISFTRNILTRLSKGSEEKEGIKDSFQVSGFDETINQDWNKMQH